MNYAAGTPAAQAGVDPALKDLEILVVDDQEANLVLLKRILEHEGYTRVRTTQDPTTVLGSLAERLPDLLLLDLHMPALDGFELMEAVGAQLGAGEDLPVLVLTADVSAEAKRRALSMGASDFLVKPLDPTEVSLRVRHLLEIHRLQSDLRRQNEDLDQRVRARTEELEQARFEIVDRLAAIAEYRDDATQEHARRMGRMCALLAAVLALDNEERGLIREATPLHDIGKVGVPDAVLLKPGPLTSAEFELIKQHTTMGAAMLAGSRSPVLRLAEEIAATHHERWDGTGYPERLAGEAIPLSGRIVALADAFDALTHERPYKSAWPLEDAIEEIYEQRGRQFDPDVVDAFARLEHDRLVGDAAASYLADPSDDPDRPLDHRGGEVG